MKRIKLPDYGVKELNPIESGKNNGGCSLEILRKSSVPVSALIRPCTLASNKYLEGLVEDFARCQNSHVKFIDV